jgi:hypothetical protein
MCAICIKEYRKGEQIFHLNCSHHFHVGCIEPWLKKATVCPICRFNLEQNLPASQAQNNF